MCGVERRPRDQGFHFRSTLGQGLHERLIARVKIRAEQVGTGNRCMKTFVGEADFALTPNHKASLSS